MTVTPIDLNAITEALTHKADLDLVNSTQNNMTAVSKSYFAGIGMPSTKYVTLSLGASGDPYTAPVNGWACVEWSSVTSDAGSSSLDVQNPAIRTFSTCLSWQRHCLPVQKGQQFRVYYSSATGRTLSFFRFYYAEGEK